MLDKTLDTALEIDWTESLGRPLRLVVSTWTEGLLVQSFEDGDKADLNITDVGDWCFKTADVAVEQWRVSYPVNRTWRLLSDGLLMRLISRSFFHARSVVRRFQGSI